MPGRKRYEIVKWYFTMTFWPIEITHQVILFYCIGYISCVALILINLDIKLVRSQWVIHWVSIFVVSTLWIVVLIFLVVWVIIQFVIEVYKVMKG